MGKQAHLRSWPAKARATVGYLRQAAGRWPDDPEPAALVGELTIKSTDFATLWARQPVRRCRSEGVTFRHPLVGELRLAEEVFQMQEDEGQRLAVFAAEPGSPAASALRLLRVTS